MANKCFLVFLGGGRDNRLISFHGEGDTEIHQVRRQLLVGPHGSPAAPLQWVGIGGLYLH